MDLHFVTNFSWENEEVIHGEINAALEIDGFQILPSDWGKDVEKMISILMWIALQNTCKSVNTSILPGDGKYIQQRVKTQPARCGSLPLRMPRYSECLRSPTNLIWLELSYSAVQPRGSVSCQSHLS